MKITIHDGSPLAHTIAIAKAARAYVKAANLLYEASWGHDREAFESAQGEARRTLDALRVAVAAEETDRGAIPDPEPTEIEPKGADR